MDFSSGSGAGAPSNAEVEQSLALIQQQMAIQSQVQSLQRSAERCFDKCITKPGTSLDSSQQKCLGYCVDRYSDTEALVSKTLLDKLQQSQRW